MQRYYERGEEQDRLDRGAGALEFARTVEIALRHLPQPPSIVADIGGGPGRYSLWLAEFGYRVRHRDVVPLHVEQLTEEAAGTDAIDTAVCDALDLDLDDESADAVLLLGPLYHLPSRDDRLTALVEARRIVRPGGVIVAAAISRWAPRLHSVLAEGLFRSLPELVDHLPDAERTGHLTPVFEGSFTGYTHRPDELADEVGTSGLDLVELLNVEGAAAMLPDLDTRLADATEREVVLDSARATEAVPELLGVGPHLLAVARRPSASG
jgi:SAM-dependent methyltransferase